MDKLKLAHEYFLGMISRPSVTLRAKDLHNIQYNAWEYADAMQAEAEKREDKTRPAVLCEVDWRLAPSWAKFWVIRNSGASLWCTIKPTLTEDCLLPNGPCGPAPSFGFIGSHIVERPQ